MKHTIQILEDAICELKMKIGSTEDSIDKIKEEAKILTQLEADLASLNSQVEEIRSVIKNLKEKKEENENQ